MLELLLLGIRQRPGLGPELFSKLGQHPGIDPIGFGQDAQRPGKITDLPGINETGREPGLPQGGHCQELVTAGGLQEDDLGRHLAQAGHQFNKARFGIGHAKARV